MCGYVFVYRWAVIASLKGTKNYDTTDLYWNQICMNYNTVETWQWHLTRAACSSDDKMQSINNNYDSVYCKQFYRIFETVERSEPNNFWIVLHGRVFDLSSLTKCVKDTNCKTNRNYPVSFELFFLFFFFLFFYFMCWTRKFVIFFDGFCIF